MSPLVSVSLNRILLSLGMLLILLLAACQGLGLCQQWEQFLLHHLSSRFLPEPPQVILITLDKHPKGFQAMDVAMALRGLGKFSPRCIVIDGLIEAEEGPVPFLPDIFSQLAARQDLKLIVPQLPSPAAHFQSVSLIRYSLHAESLSWPKVEGEAVPSTGDAFLPDLSNLDSSLPLFATASHGVPVGSLWWWTLPEALHKSPPVLLWNKLLLFSTHTQILLTPSGAALPALPGEFIEMPLDDFLLQMEKREQGTLSPTFDSLWNRSTVILGTSLDFAKATALASLLQELSWRHLALWKQGLMTLFWMIVLVCFRKQTLLPPKFLSLTIFILVGMATLLLLPHGIIFPFLPALWTAFLLLLP